jgi:hypothetical protein
MDSLLRPRRSNQKVIVAQDKRQTHESPNNAGQDDRLDADTA